MAQMTGQQLVQARFVIPCNGWNGVSSDAIPAGSASESIESSRSPPYRFAGLRALASVIAHEYGHGHTELVPIVAYGLAGVVSASRFTAQRHYASDIVAGGAMGWFIGRYVYKTHMDHAIHHHAWLRPRVVPQFHPSAGLYGIYLGFGN